MRLIHQLTLLFCLTWSTYSMAGVYNFTNISLSSNEAVPSVESNGYGTFNALYDDEDNVLLYSYNYTLSEGSSVTASHFHGPAEKGQVAGIASSELFGSFLTILEGEETGGIVVEEEEENEHEKEEISNLQCFFGFCIPDLQDNPANEPTLNAGYISGKLILTEEQEKELIDGKWYLNVHTTAHPGGEIRGQLTTNTVDRAIAKFDKKTLILDVSHILVEETIYESSLKLSFDSMGIAYFEILSITQKN